MRHFTVTACNYWSKSFNLSTSRCSQRKSMNGQKQRYQIYTIAFHLNTIGGQILHKVYEFLSLSQRFESVTPSFQTRVILHLLSALFSSMYWSLVNLILAVYRLFTFICNEWFNLYRSIMQEFALLVVTWKLKTWN